MASYKVIQDIEAEDKLIGPLTVKQVFYALIAAAIIFIGWFIGKRTSYYAIIPFVLASLPLVFLALPLGRDQSNDVWLFAKLNFLFKPRKRLWFQTGGSSKFLVIESGQSEKAESRTDGRSAEDIESQIRSLSHILDSRGRSTRNKPTPVVAAAKTAVNSAADNEHENRHSSLNRGFHKLLSHHRENHKKRVDQKLRQTLRAQSHNPHLHPSTLDIAKPQQIKTPPSKHLSATISEITKSGNLKISTLESLARVVKSKERLKRSKDKQR